MKDALLLYIYVIVNHRFSEHLSDAPFYENKKNNRRESEAESPSLLCEKEGIDFAC